MQKKFYSIVSAICLAGLTHLSAEPAPPSAPDIPGGPMSPQVPGGPMSPQIPGGPGNPGIPGQPPETGPGTTQTAPPAPIPVDTPNLDVEQDENVPALRVNSTNQSYNFLRPWDKGTPFTRRGLGIVVSGGSLLVTGELVANNTFIELERPSTGERVPATVEHVDYEANLALIKPQDEKILKGITPLQITTNSKVGDKLSAWQFEETGILIKTEGLLTSIQVGDYPLEGSDLMVYKITIALQPRDGSFTVPLIKEGKIAGLIMRYDPRTQNADAIAGSVIEHFLKDTSSGQPYKGFPKAGIAFTTTRDPQLRRYAKIPDSEQGVYVTNTFKGGPADKAGIKPGDVLAKIDGSKIDPDGNYTDPQYGRMALSNLTARKYAGDKSVFTLLRDGKPVDVEVILERREADDYIIPPYTIDRGPNYFSIGGIVFEELTRQYLRSWGGDWVNRAPRKLVYYDRYQTDILKEPQKRLVILSQVLPTPLTIGYEEYNNLIVTKVNGRDITDLDALKEAFKHPVDGFHVIETLDDPKTIHLDAHEVEESEQQVRKAYGIPKS